jgi:hypothetical protein
VSYADGYDAVRRYARRWSKERGATEAAAYVPLDVVFRGGDLRPCVAHAMGLISELVEEAP